MFSRIELAADFRRLGLTPGDTVMLHASVRSVGPIAGGPDRIHEALMDAISPGGTLMMYASCPRYYDEVGRGNLTAEEEREVLEKLPAFDPDMDRSAQDNGILVEFLRTYPGTRASRQAARFIAIGAQADFITAGQPRNYAFGKDSPLEKFLEQNGKIVLLGSDHDAVTFLHYVEHTADIPGRRIAHYKVPMLVDGRLEWLDTEEVDTANGAHENWPDRFFAQIVDGYLARTGNPGGRVGHSNAVVLSAAGLNDHARPIMEAVARGESLRAVAPRLKAGGAGPESLPPEARNPRGSR